MTAYFPQDVWFEFPSGVAVKTVGTYATLRAPLSKINVHVRGGFVIPMQTPGANLILGRGNPFSLLVAPSAAGNASGNLFWDDGDSIGSLNQLCRPTGYPNALYFPFRFGWHEGLQLFRVHLG